MSKGVFINSLDTYIGLALYEEFLGENPEENLEYELFGTYYNKEVSERPKYVKKMMKLKEKPGLFRQYMLNKMDYFVYDLHSGKLADLEWGIKALTKAPLESEKTVIVISSVLAWGGNPHNMVEDKPIEYDADGNPIVKDDADGDADGDKKPDDNTDGIDVDESKLKDNKYQDPDSSKVDDGADAMGGPEEEEWEESENGDGDGHEGKDNSDNVIDPDNQTGDADNNQPNDPIDPDNPDQVKPTKRRRKKKTKEKKEIKYKRIGYSEEEFQKRIPCDHYQQIKEFEDYLLNLKIENLNVVIVCAGVPYGNCETVFNYFFRSAWLQYPPDLPYFNTGENLVPTIHVKDLAKIIKKLINGSKPETPYIFAIDQTVDKSLKNIIGSISRGIGSGLTQSITPEDKDINFYLNHFDAHDFYIDQTIYEKWDARLILNSGELSWPKFLQYDIMLNPSKFIEEEFEWHCKEGIPEKIQQLLDEFAKNRRLRPLKIVLNCTDNSVRTFYAKRLAEFFNIPIINYENVMEMLSLKSEKLTEEEIVMKQKYLFLKERMEFITANPDYNNEENLLLYDTNEIMMEAFKYLLKENASKNRGYVLEGMPVNVEEVSSLYFYKKEVEPEEGVDDMDMGEEMEDPDDMDGEMGVDGDVAMDMGMDVDDGADKMGDATDEPKNDDPDNVNMGDKSIQDADMADHQSNPDLTHPDAKPQDDVPKVETKPKKKKKIKPKKYKVHFDKNLLPESVITISIDNSKTEIDNIFWEVENFYQENNIEILNLIIDNGGVKTKSKEFEEKANEFFEMMRIYIERNSRPFNYFLDTDSDVNDKRENYLKEKVKYHDMERENQRRKAEEAENQKEKEFWMKMENRIEAIKKDQEEIAYFDDCPTRKFLLLNIMPILTKGMLEVCKINPIDPVDYLADFLFKNYSD